MHGMNVSNLISLTKLSDIFVVCAHYIELDQSLDKLRENMDSCVKHARKHLTPFYDSAVLTQRGTFAIYLPTISAIFVNFKKATIFKQWLLHSRLLNFRYQMWYPRVLKTIMQGC